MKEELNLQIKKDALHHAYVIEGGTPELASLVEYLPALGLPSAGSTDFFYKVYESFSIEDARELKSSHNQKSIGDGKKVFVLDIGQFSREAPHALLKVFEEPISGTYFFILTENPDQILGTLSSRVITIKNKRANNLETKVDIKDAKKFVSLTPKERLDAIAKIVKNHEGDETSHALKKEAENLMKNLLVYIHNTNDLSPEKIFALKEIETSLHYLRQSGSSVKMLLEHIALVL
jgi:DNA polymerase III gamma/tau subunit